MPAAISSGAPGSGGFDGQLINDFSSYLREDDRDFAGKGQPKRPSSTGLESLVVSDVHNFHTGIGEQIVDSIVPAIESARSEVILVTCFWAKSASQQRLGAALLELAHHAKLEQRLVNVKLCFSSLSLWQKLTHSRSLDGHSYPPQTWVKKLGLPPENDLQQTFKNGTTVGLRLTVKSVFVKPFSVMHPKFVVVDRQRVFLPSCNVSWENWFEGCVELRGQIVPHFLNLHHQFWERGISLEACDWNEELRAQEQQQLAIEPDKPIGVAGPDFNAIPSLFLHSDHHSNPHFRPFWFQSPPPTPKTPLNTFLLTTFNHAQRQIYIQTPNLTSPPVLSAVLCALDRGVDVRIVTSPRMMVLEQLFTAGTITEWCVQSLISRYHSCVKQRKTIGSLEDGLVKAGRLSVRYYHPRAAGGEKEPVKSHLKLTVVDGRVVVLGSGNMDRASWFTSQELGVAFFSEEMAEIVMQAVVESLEGRLGEEWVK